MTSRSTPSARANTASHSRVSITNANGLPGPRCATVVQPHRRPARPVALQPADGRAGDARAPRAVPAACAARPARPTGSRTSRCGAPAAAPTACPTAGGRHQPVGGVAVLAQVDGVPERVGVPQVVPPQRPRRREVRRHRVRDAVQRHAGEHAGHAEAVVAVEVGQADPGDRAARHAGQQQLPLGALAGVEQEALGVPAQQVAVVVAGAGGRLAGRAQHHQLTIGHVGGAVAAGRAGRADPTACGGW